MEGKLFWLFYDDVFSGWIPPNHVMVFWTLEEPGWKSLDEGEADRNADEGRAREDKEGDTNA